jgi:hypothetical protein
MMEAFVSPYRVYRLNGVGNIERVELIEAENDEEAVIAGKALNHTATCEIWDRDRLVARLPAFQARA